MLVHRLAGVVVPVVRSRVVLPRPLLGPDNSIAPPTWFLEAIRGIFRTTTKTPTKPPIMFELGELAASHNAKLLRGFEYNFISEKMADLLSNGMDYVFTRELGEEECEVKSRPCSPGVTTSPHSRRRSRWAN